MPELSSKAAIQKGSKSFYLSSLIFSRRERYDCWKLYGWCRTCDDRVDFAPSPQEASHQLQLIRTETEIAIRSQSAAPETLPTVFSEFGSVCGKYSIPAEYPLELLAGFAMDVEGYRYQTLKDVELYGYRVAGVVGLMMSHITGVANPEAYKNAVDMGVAMQLTNIARDVFEDASIGRVYLPEDWLREEGVALNEITLVEKRDAVYRVVLRLLDRADVLYRSGRLGLPALPIRASLAVSAASEIYAAIGTKIRNRGPAALTSRVYVTRFEKFGLLAKGLFNALARRF